MTDTVFRHGPGSAGDLEALQRSEARFRALVAGISEMIFLFDADGRLRYASPAVERLLGVQLDQTFFDVFELIHPDDLDAARAGLQWLREHKASLDGAGMVDQRRAVVRVRTKNGQWRILEALGRNLLDDPDVRGLLVTARDITEVRQRDEQALDGAVLLERMAQGAGLYETMGELLAMLRKWLPGCVPVAAQREADGVIRVMPSRELPDDLALLLNGITRDSPIGRAARSPSQPVVFTDIAQAAGWEEIGRAFVDHGLVAAWLWMLVSDDGQELGMFAIFPPERRGPSELEHLLFAQAAHLATIILQRHFSERALAHQAMHDALTGLPNRNLLVDRIEQALALSARNGDSVAVLFLDLDRFKVVNDSLGHAAGDRLLCMVADRWQHVLRQGDTVGRFGGDEFIVVANAVSGRAGANALARRLIAAVDTPFVLDGVEVVIGVSAGVAVAENGVGVPDQLIRDADAAMYAAKNRGRGRYVVFERPMHDEVVERLRMEADLRRALSEDELVVHYQPMLRTSDRAVAGLEALVRWERPGHGLVLPAEFVDLAEETGLILPVGSWVLREVVRQAASWARDPLLADLDVTVNVSARQLVQPGLVDEIMSVTREFGLDPARLWLEVTESVLADDPELVASVIDQLHGIGVRVAIDDFGSGYTSLEYARRFGVLSGLKIDRQFVVGLDDASSHSEAIVAALVVLARGLGAAAVAEGVETEKQLHALEQLGCDMVQGYLFGRPVRADELRSRIVELHRAHRVTPWIGGEERRANG